MKEEENVESNQEFTQWIDAEYGTVPPANERHGESLEYTAFIDAV